MAPGCTVPTLPVHKRTPHNTTHTTHNTRAHTHAHTHAHTPRTHNTHTTHAHIRHTTRTHNSYLFICTISDSTGIYYSGVSLCVRVCAMSNGRQCAKQLFTSHCDGDELIMAWMVMMLMLIMINAQAYFVALNVNIRAPTGCVAGSNLTSNGFCNVTCASGYTPAGLYTLHSYYICTQFTRIRYT